MKRSIWVVLIGLSLAALVLRLAFVERRSDLEDWDSAIYIELGENLASGHGFRVHPGAREHVWFQPGFPLAIAALSRLTGGGESAAYLVSAIAGALIVFPLFFIARHLYSQRAGLIAAGLAVFHYRMVDAGSLPITEMLYTVLWLWGIYAALRICEPGRHPVGWYLTFGAALGLAGLVRTEGVFSFAVLFGLLAALALWRRRHPGLPAPVESPGVPRSRAQNADAWGLLLAAGAFIVLLGPYMLYLYGELHQLAITGRIHRTVFAIMDATRETYEVHAGSPFAFVREHPAYALARILENLAIIVREHCVWAFPPIIVALTGVALFGSKWSTERSRREALLIATFLFPWLTLYGITGILPRYYFASVALGLVWAAQGAATLLEWAEQSSFGLPRAWRVLQPWAAGAMLMAGLSLTFGRELTFPFRSGGFPMHPQMRKDRQIAGWFRAHAGPDAKILASSPRIAYYGGVEYADYRDNRDLDAATLGSFLLNERIDYLVADDFIVKQLYPRLAFLASDATAVPEYLTRRATLAYEQDDGAPATLQIYGVLREALSAGCREGSVASPAVVACR
jgi:hypothetical protein